MKNHPKKVLCTSLNVDVMGSPKATVKQIRAIEKGLRNVVRRNFKAKGFSLRVA